jgi:hypothetical protein
LYVTDSADKSITIFPASANGNIPPTVTISGLPSGLVEPNAAPFDASGNLYAANISAGSASGSAGNIVIFKPPLRSIRPRFTLLVHK